MGDEPEENQKLRQELEQARRALWRKEVELKAVLAQSEEISHTDPLTYLPNRRKIVSSIQHEVLRANRYHTPLSISMMDIDHFKQVNDTYGHAAGEEVLRTLANELREGTRSPDMAGRLGGEEFLIILPNAKLGAAIQQAERLSDSIRRLGIPVEDQTISLTVSFGLAEYHIGSEAWDELLQRADAALLLAKRRGRNQWVAG